MKRKKIVLLVATIVIATIIAIIAIIHIGNEIARVAAIADLT